MSNEVPFGFELFETQSPFNLLVGPYYYRHIDDQLTFGLRVNSNHCNSAGRLHGGMVNAIADIALGHNIGITLLAREESKTTTRNHPSTVDSKTDAGGPAAPMITVSMSTDFVGTAKLGDWVEVHVDVTRVGQSLAFANAYLSLEGDRIARVSAVFKLLR